MLARIDNNSVVEIRDGDINDVPEHKRSVWRPVIGDPPNVDVRFYSIAEDPTYEIFADKVVRSWATALREVASVKPIILRQIDEDAERVRLSFITPGDGMAMTYQEKFRQALLVNELGKASCDAMQEAEFTAKFPVLSASVGIEGSTLWECAGLVISRFSAFANAARSIETKRLSAKRQVSMAETSADVMAAYNSISW